MSIVSKEKKMNFHLPYGLYNGRNIVSGSYQILKSRSSRLPTKLTFNLRERSFETVRHILKARFVCPLKTTS